MTNDESTKHGPATNLEQDAESALICVYLCPSVVKNS